MVRLVLLIEELSIFVTHVGICGTLVGTWVSEYSEGHRL